MSKVILLVEDNLDILKTNRRMLELSGYTVETATNLRDARKSMDKTPPDLIVLDIMLPDSSGLEFCAEIRERGVSVPVLFLTALGEDSDVVTGLRAGGDDYMSKPYDYEVLLARIEALLRRTQQESADHIGPFYIDRIARRVYRNGEDMLLKPRELSLFCLLVENPNVFFSPGTLYERIWGGNAAEDVRTVYAHVSSLRKKLELYGGSTLEIEQKRGKGYRLIMRPVKTLAE